MRLLNYVGQGLQQASRGRCGQPAELVEAVRSATEALVWGEKHDGALFDLFCERQTLAGFVSALLTPQTPQTVRVQLLQSLSIMVQNARRDTSFYYLLSGGHLNQLLAGEPDLRDEEVLAYYVAFIKSLALRLDGETARLLLNRERASTAAGFPLFAQAVRFATHRDHMVCTSARTALLSLLRIQHPEVQARGAEAACELLVPVIANALRTCWASASTAVRAQQADALQKALEAEEDLLGLVNELFLMGNVAVAEAASRSLLSVALLPLFSSLDPPLSYPGTGDEAPGLVAQEAANGIRRADEAAPRHFRQEALDDLAQRFPKRPYSVGCEGDLGLWANELLGEGGEARAAEALGPAAEAAREFASQVLGLGTPVPQGAAQGKGLPVEALRSLASPPPPPPPPQREGAQMLASLCGEWRIFDEGRPCAGVVTVYDKGYTMYEGQHWDEKDLHSDGHGAIRRGDGWAVEMQKSNPSMLVWTKPGESFIVWHRREAGLEGRPATQPPRHLAEAAQGPPSAAVAVRAAAMCAHVLGAHRSVVEPLAQVLIWPSVSSSLVTAIHAPGPNGTELAAVAFGEASPRKGGRDASPPSVLIPNPFRAAFLARLPCESPPGGARQSGVRMELPLAAWAVKEIQAAVPSMQNVLPPPEGLVDALRMRSQLPRSAQCAMVTVLLELTAPPRPAAVRSKVRKTVIGALSEASEFLQAAAAAGHEGGGGGGGGTVEGADLVRAFVTEWQWYRSQSMPIDLPASSGSAECLLECARGGRRSAQGEAAGRGLAAQAVCALLLLRRLCFELSGQTGSQADAMRREPCPLNIDASPSGETHGQGGFGSGVGETPSLEAIECALPNVPGCALVLHPTQLLVTSAGCGPHPPVRLPIWRAAARTDPRSPLSLKIQVTEAPNEVSLGEPSGAIPRPAWMPAPQAGPREVQLRFADRRGCAVALQHIQACRARELRRLLTEISFFAEGAMLEAAAAPPASTWGMVSSEGASNGSARPHCAFPLFFSCVQPN